MPAQPDTDKYLIRYRDFSCPIVPYKKHWTASILMAQLVSVFSRGTTAHGQRFCASTNHFNRQRSLVKWSSWHGASPGVIWKLIERLSIGTCELLMDAALHTLQALKNNNCKVLTRIKWSKGSFEYQRAKWYPFYLLFTQLRKEFGGKGLRYAILWTWNHSNKLLCNVLAAHSWTIMCLAREESIPEHYGIHHA